MQGEQADHRSRLLAGDRDVEAEADQHEAARIATVLRKDRTHPRSISVFKAQVFLSIEIA